MPLQFPIFTIEWIPTSCMSADGPMKILTGQRFHSFIQRFLVLSCGSLITRFYSDQQRLWKMGWYECE